MYIDIFLDLSTFFFVWVEEEQDLVININIYTVTKTVTWCLEFSLFYFFHFYLNVMSPYRYLVILVLPFIKIHCFKNKIPIAPWLSLKC